jgi:hypothetical protein
MKQERFMAKQKPNTRAEGASEERQTWIAKLKRELKTPLNVAARDMLVYLLAWGAKRCLRYNKKPGGLGNTKNAAKYG